MPSPRSLLYLFAVVFLSLSLIACATLRAQQARSAHINDRTAQHVYDVDCTSLMLDVREMFFERGYSTHAFSEGDTTLETDWHEIRDGDPPFSRERHLTQCFTVDDGTRIEITRNYDPPERSLSTDRDLDMEWAVLQRVDPDTAHEIAREADEAAARARDGR